MARAEFGKLAFEGPRSLATPLDDDGQTGKLGRAGDSEAMHQSLDSSKTGPLVAASRQEVGHLGLTQALELVRQHMIVEALRRSGGSKRAAAKLLRIDRAYLRRRLR
jgi:DNA-binding NtrC family response regulator